jgi:hypothetical protein
MSKKNNLYLGKAGQLVVMAEFLARGWNVATPEVDIGDDLFVVEDKKGIFVRVQVKTAQATERQGGFSLQFNIPVKQLIEEISPEIYYVFVARRGSTWVGNIIISREMLAEIFGLNTIGSVYKENLILYFAFQNDKVTCSKTDFTPFLNNYEDFPTIEH